MDKVLIETYLDTQEIPHTEEEVDQYNEALLNLGLEHLAIKHDKKPISPMSDLEVAVYKALCPKQTNIKKYNHPIPIRVLEALTECKSFLEDISGSSDLRIEIWEDKDPDPIMIAQIGYGDRYMIGRWGKELQDFPTLLKRAKEIVLADAAKKVEEARSIVKLFDKNPDSFATGVLSNRISSIYF